MNTADRRDQLLNLLYRKATTVPAVARSLGVSERTIYRDIAALRASGHDVLATPGPGGGVQVAQDSRPLAVHFEVAEIVGLALSVAILKATSHMPFARSAEAALARASKALSPGRRRSIEDLQQRILVGTPASQPVRQSLGPVEDTLLPVVERCLTSARAMTFDYVDAARRRSRRKVECVALVLHAPTWYVLAWDLDKDASRLFRTDRIRAPKHGVALPAQRPLASVLREVDPAIDAWQRRPIG